MNKTKKKFLSWFDQHGLFSLGLFLLVFIPLYPKIPLLEAIPGYLVRVRLEDLLTLVTAVIFLIQLLRKKIQWQNSFFFLIVCYAVIGLLSLLIAILLQQTIPLQFLHIAKSLLHYLRYLEYFSLFFFLYAGVKNRQHLRITLWVMLIVLNLIFIYGVGQRYFAWPAFSTMNREYSKGQALILPPDIKLISTFGGHYDLAAFLVIILPLITAWLLRTKKHKLQIWLFLSNLAGLWLLWQSASKIALTGWAFSTAGVIWFSLYQKVGARKSLLLSLVSGVVFGSSILSFLWLYKKPTLYKLAPFLRPSSYQTPVDVQTKLNETWSKNARKYGLSMGIRLDTLWPHALAGFSLNPYTGKGYATLNKGGINEFTEADSTDNNYLRVLGETGLFGFVTFFGVIFLLLDTLRQKLPSDELIQAASVGLVAATGGLLVNAAIIDVFAASKVAFTYWGLAGVIIKAYQLNQPKVVAQLEAQRWQQLVNFLKKHWPLLLSSLILILLVHKRPFSEYSLITNFTLDQTQVKYLAFAKCWWESGLTQACLQRYQPGINLIYSLFILPFYALYHQPAMFYFANLFLLAISVKFLYQIMRKLTADQTLQFIFLLGIFTARPFYQLPSKFNTLNLWLTLGLLVIAKVLPTLKSKTKPHFMMIIIISGIIIQFLATNSFSQIRSNVLASWRDTYRPVTFATIRRANHYLAARADTTHTKPILLTDINSTLFDLYGQNKYQVAPIEVEKMKHYRQLLLESSPSASKSAMIKNQLTQEVFITNAKADSDFESYKQNFGIQLKGIDCHFKCNYYQLLPHEVDIPSQPITLNQLKFSHSVTNPHFIVISDQLVADIGAGVFSRNRRLLKKRLLLAKPDLIFVTGDKEKNLKNYAASFLQRLKPELNVPVVSIYKNQAQIFARGDNWYVTFDATTKQLDPDQKIFLYNTLLQLEKHPEVKHVYVISPNSQWLQRRPDNYYSWQDFYKALNTFQDRVEFKFIFDKD